VDHGTLVRTPTKRYSATFLTRAIAAIRVARTPTRPIWPAAGAHAIGGPGVALRPRYGERRLVSVLLAGDGIRAHGEAMMCWEAAIEPSSEAEAGMKPPASH